MVFVDEAAEQCANRDKESDEDWKQDLDRIRRTQVDDTKNDQADQLYQSEKVDRTSGYPSGVVIRRIQSRIHKPVSQTLNELDAFE